MATGNNLISIMKATIRGNKEGKRGNLNFNRIYTQ